MSIGVAMAGGGGKPHPDHFYQTPPLATVALVRAMHAYIGTIVYEPACGTGDLAMVLERMGYEVIGTDLVDRGYGTGGRDYLKEEHPCDTIITNPPFKHAEAFIKHGLSQDPAFFALLLKSTFWQAARRRSLYLKHPPKATLPLTWRLDFTKKKAPVMECTWFVWGSRVPGPSAPALLPKPENENVGVFA